MKRSRVTILFMTLAQLPVALLLWIVVVIERGLTHCLVWLGNPMLRGRAVSVWGEVVKGRESQADARSELDIYWGWLKGQDAEVVASVRRRLEGYCGVPRLAQRADPHLYAVASPTKRENLCRIVHVFQMLPPQRLRRWLFEVVDDLR